MSTRRGCRAIIPPDIDFGQISGPLRCEPSGRAIRERRQPNKPVQSLCLRLIRRELFQDFVIAAYSIDLPFSQVVIAHHAHEPDRFRDMKSPPLWIQQAQVVFPVEDDGNLVQIAFAHTQVGVADLREEVIRKPLVALFGDLFRAVKVADRVIGGAEKVEELGATGISFDQAFQLDDGVAGTRLREMVKPVELTSKVRGQIILRNLRDRFRGNLVADEGVGIVEGRFSAQLFGRRGIPFRFLLAIDSFLRVLAFWRTLLDEITWPPAKSQHRPFSAAH